MADFTNFDQISIVALDLRYNDVPFGLQTCPVQSLFKACRHLVPGIGTRVEQIVFGEVYSLLVWISVTSRENVSDYMTPTAWMLSGTFSTLG